MARKPTYEELEQRVKELEAEVIDCSRIEEALRNSEERFRTFMDNLGDVAYEADSNGIITYANKMSEKITGMSLENLVGKSFVPLFTEESKKVAVDVFQRTLKGENAEYELCFTNGRIGQFKNEPLRDMQQNIIGVFGIARDITERKRAEEELRKHRNHLEEMVAQRTSALRKTNEELQREITERKRAEEALKSQLELEQIVANVSTNFINLAAEEIDDGINRALETIGTFSRVDRSYVFLFYDNGTMMDNTHEWCAEGIEPQIHNLQGLSVDAAPWWMGKLNRFEKIHIPCVADLPPQASAEREILQAQDIQSLVVVPMVYGGSLLGFIGFDSVRAEKTWPEQSITLLQIIAEIFSNAFRRKQAEEEKKRLEAQLVRAQKMESIGTLAGGVAHDFNNLLMGIQGTVSLMLLNIESTHPYYERLKNIEQQIQSGARLTSHLLGYARRGRYEVKPVDLNQMLKETSETFGRARKNVTIHRELAEGLLAIEADSGQIEQVLLNLFVNAADAMPGGGDLILKTMNVTHKDMKGKLYHPKPGKYVLLTVTDTGAGMDKETMERIFDPFFTTKEMGRGTGLGLASSYGIVKGHGGYIDVDSKKGQGTTFTIYLPASERRVREAVKAAEPLIKGTGTVLLVDDEEVIVEVGKELLEGMGYGVLTAKDGKEAIEVYEKDPDEIDIVILDMVMPNMGGGEAYDRMKEISPDIKVLLSSGFSIDGEATDILERGCNGFIQKPFNMMELSEKIGEILDKK